jgi:hypothetical protein
MVILLKILLCILPVIGALFGLGIVICTAKKLINEENVQKLLDEHPNEYQSLRVYSPSKIIKMLKIMGWTFVIVCGGFISLIIIL